MWIETERQLGSTIDRRDATESSGQASREHKARRMITDRFNALVLTGTVRKRLRSAVGMAFRETNPLSLYFATQDRTVSDALSIRLESKPLQRRKIMHGRHQVGFAFSLPACRELEWHLGHGVNVSSGQNLD